MVFDQGLRAEPDVERKRLKRVLRYAKMIPYHLDQILNLPNGQKDRLNRVQIKNRIRSKAPKAI